jgi:hypothetical protein
MIRRHVHPLELLRNCRKIRLKVGRSGAGRKEHARRVMSEHDFAIEERLALRGKLGEAKACRSSHKVPDSEYPGSREGLVKLFGRMP